MNACVYDLYGLLDGSSDNKVQVAEDTSLASERTVAPSKPLTDTPYSLLAARVPVECRCIPVRLAGGRSTVLLHTGGLSHGPSPIYTVYTMGWAESMVWSDPSDRMWRSTPHKISGVAKYARKLLL